MTASILQFVLSAAVIIIAGAALTQFGDIIADRTKLGGMLVGTILIAGATSLPELGVNINTVRLGATDMALGDLMGSSLMNLLILAVLDLTHYSRGRMFSEAASGQALAACTSIALTAIAAIFIVLAPPLESWQLWRLGPGSVVLLAAYLFGLRSIHRGRNSGHSADERTAERAIWPPVLRKLELKGAIVGYVVAGAAILGAAPFLAQAARDLAEQTGLGGTFFGSTFVALSTSLPEVVTTLTAVRLGAFDMAVGNVLGSNCFNMVLLVPLDFVGAEPLLSSVSSTHVFTALCVILVTCVVILGQLRGVERKRSFLEPDAWLALGLIVGSFAGLYVMR